MSQFSGQRTGEGGVAGTIEAVVPMIGGLAFVGQELHDDHKHISQYLSPVSLICGPRSDGRCCNGLGRDGSRCQASQYVLGVVGKCVGCCGSGKRPVSGNDAQVS